MGIKTIDEKHLENIADAIRERFGVARSYKPREMANAILSGGAGTSNYLGSNHYIISPSLDELPANVLSREWTQVLVQHETGIQLMGPAYTKVRPRDLYTTHDLTTIGAGVFADQTQLEVIDLPASVTTIDNDWLYSYFELPLKAIILRGDLGPTEYTITPRNDTNAIWDTFRRYSEVDHCVRDVDLYVSDVAYPKWEEWLWEKHYKDEADLGMDLPDTDVNVGLNLLHRISDHPEFNEDYDAQKFIDEYKEVAV